MKIAVIAPRFHTNLYYRVKALEQQGHTVRLFSLYRGQSEYYDQIDCKVFGLSLLSRIISWINRRLLSRQLRTNLELKLLLPDDSFKNELIQFRPDLILLKSFQSRLTLKTTQIACQLGIKVVILSQTRKNHIKNSVLLFKFYLNFLEKRNVAGYITPIAINEKVFKEIGVSNIVYMPFVYPAQDFNKNRESQSIRIISIGKFVKRKDQLLLLQAIQHLKDHYSLKLTLIGEIADQEYFQQVTHYIAEHQLESIVRIKQNVNYVHMSEQYQMHDLFILPSYKEPAAYSIVEAMAHKLPVISADDCGTSCYVRPGKNGFLFKRSDAQSLIEAIENIIRDRKRLLEMGENSREMAARFHSFESFYKKFEEVLTFI